MPSNRQRTNSSTTLTAEEILKAEAAAHAIQAEQDARKMTEAAADIAREQAAAEAAAQQAEVQPTDSSADAETISADDKDGLKQEQEIPYVKLLNKRHPAFSIGKHRNPLDFRKLPDGSVHARFVGKHIADGWHEYAQQAAEEMPDGRIAYNMLSTLDGNKSCRLSKKWQIDNEHLGSMYPLRNTAQTAASAIYPAPTRQNAAVVQAAQKFDASQTASKFVRAFYKRAMDAELSYAMFGLDLQAFLACREFLLLDADELATLEQDITAEAAAAALDNMLTTAEQEQEQS